MATLECSRCGKSLRVGNSPWGSSFVLCEPCFYLIDRHVRWERERSREEDGIRITEHEAVRRLRERWGI